LKIKAALLEGAQYLTGATGTPNLDAELLLGELVGLDRAGLILKGQEELSEEDWAQYWEQLEKRRRGCPVQYLVREQEFMGLPFYVDERVLIPRPDTELLVEVVIEAMKVVDRPRILDLCTGSGAVAVSLAHYLKCGIVIGTDISPDALEVAQHNAEKNGVSERIHWHVGDLLEALPPGTEKLDAVVSNPPYIQSAVIPTLDVNVREYEPRLALDGGSDGLDCYRRIVNGAAGWLKPGGLLALEIGYDQRNDLLTLIETTGLYGCTECRQDLAGHDRVILAWRL